MHACIYIYIYSERGIAVAAVACFSPALYSLLATQRSGNCLSNASDALLSRGAVGAPWRVGARTRASFGSSRKSPAPGLPPAAGGHNLEAAQVRVAGARVPSLACPSPSRVP